MKIVFRKLTDIRPYETNPLPSRERLVLCIAGGGALENPSQYHIQCYG